MKTIRELINLIETAQNPVDDDVEHLANVAADAYWSGKFGMTSATEKVKMARDIVQAVEDGRLSIEELRQDIRDLDKPGVAEGIVDTIRGKNYARLADRSAAKRATASDNFDEPEHQKQTDIMKQRNLKSRLLNKKGVAEGEISQQYTVAVDCGEDGTFTVKVHAGDKGEALRKAQKIVRNEYDTYPEGARIVGQGVAEGTNGWVVYNIRGRIIKNFADEAEARQYAKQYGFYVKPQGVAEGQATRTCPQCDGSGEDTLDPTKSCRRCGGKGHIPMSPREQGVAEDEATAQKYAVRMNAQQLGSTNRTKYTWTGTASSDDQAREMAIAYADRHGFKNIVVKEISKKEQAVDEQATPEAVAKINSLFSK